MRPSTSGPSLFADSRIRRIYPACTSIIHKPVNNAFAQLDQSTQKTLITKKSMWPKSTPSLDSGWGCRYETMLCQHHTRCSGFNHGGGVARTSIRGVMAHLYVEEAGCDQSRPQVWVSQPTARPNGPRGDSPNAVGNQGQSYASNKIEMSWGQFDFHTSL